MLRNLNLQAWVAVEKGKKTCPDLRMPFSIVASAALSILLLSAGAAGAQTVYMDDYGGYEPTIRTKTRSSSTSDGEYGFGVDSVGSTLGETNTNTALASSMSHFSSWTPKTSALSGVPVSSGNLTVGGVPEPSTLLLALAGLVGAMGVTRRRGP